MSGEPHRNKFSINLQYVGSLLNLEVSYDLFLDLNYEIGGQVCILTICFTLLFSYFKILNMFTVR